MAGSSGKSPRRGWLWLIRILIIVICVFALFFTAKHLVRLRELRQKTAEERSVAFLLPAAENFGAVHKFGTICKK